MCVLCRDDDSKSSHDRKTHHVKHIEGAINVKDEPLDKVQRWYLEIPFMWMNNWPSGMIF